MFSGIAVIYISGIVQLKFVLELQWMKSVLIGALPFIPGDILKIIIAIGIYKKLKKTGVLESIKIKI